MSPLLNKRWYHSFLDKMMPGNCRSMLQNAFAENKTASTTLRLCINQHEHEVVAALKGERRRRERKA